MNVHIGVTGFVGKHLGILLWLQPLSGGVMLNRCRVGPQKLLQEMRRKDHRPAEAAITPATRG